MLAEAGVDLPTIMKRVDHDDSKTTLKIYMHITERMQRNASEKVNVHFSELLKGAVLKGCEVSVGFIQKRDPEGSRFP